MLPSPAPKRACVREGAGFFFRWYRGRLAIIPNQSLGTPGLFPIGETRFTGVLPASVRILFPLRLDMACYAFGQARSILHDTSGKSTQSLDGRFGIMRIRVRWSFHRQVVPPASSGNGAADASFSRMRKVFYRLFVPG